MLVVGPVGGDIPAETSVGQASVLASPVRSWYFDSESPSDIPLFTKSGHEPLRLTDLVRIMTWGGRMATKSSRGFSRRGPNNGMRALKCRIDAAFQKNRAERRAGGAAAPLGSERWMLGFCFSRCTREGVWIGGSRSGQGMSCRSPRIQFLLTGIWHIISADAPSPRGETGPPGPPTGPHYGSRLPVVRLYTRNS